MRKRLIQLTGALLISGASGMALAMPASAAPLSTVDATAVTATVLQSSSALRFADTNTGTTTGTLLKTIGSVVATATF